MWEWFDTGRRGRRRGSPRTVGDGGWEHLIRVGCQGALGVLGLTMVLGPGRGRRDGGRGLTRDPLRQAQDRHTMNGEWAGDGCAEEAGLKRGRTKDAAHSELGMGWRAFGQGGLPGAAGVRPGCWVPLGPGRGRRDGGGGRRVGWGLGARKRPVRNAARTKDGRAAGVVTGR